MVKNGLFIYKKKVYMHIFVYLYRFTVYLVIFKVNCEFIQAKWKKIKFKLKQPLEVFTKVSQNSQENFCARVSFLIKLQVSGTKKRLWHNFVKFLRTPFLKERLWWLLLSLMSLFSFWEFTNIFYCSEVLKFLVIQQLVR